MTDINQYIRDNYLDNTDEQLAIDLSISAKAVRGRRRRMGLTKDGNTVIQASSKTDNGVTILEKLLEENNISINEVGSIRLSSYQQGQKTPEGGSEVLNLGGAAVTLRVDSNLATGPEWPVVQQAAPIKLERRKVNKVVREMKKAVILPDPQIGYRRDLRTGELDSFHDEDAMAVALAIIEDTQPDVIVNLGDFMDFATFGRFDQEPGFQITTQAAIDRGHKFLVEQQQAAPNAHVVLIAGNHDLRIQTYIIKNAMAAFGLTRANAPEEWPVMSVQYLLRLDELGVEYVDGYPAGEYYINDRLRCEHGYKHAPRGKVAAKIAADETVSVITGHMHRVESVHKTTRVRSGANITVGMTLGCLCKITGEVPSTKSAIGARGKVVPKYMDWQQAIGVVDYVEGDGPFNICPVLIHEGQAVHGEKLYQA